MKLMTSNEIFKIEAHEKLKIGVPISHSINIFPYAEPKATWTCKT